MAWIMRYRNVLITISVAVLATVGGFFVLLSYRDRPATEDNRPGGVTQAQAYILPVAETNYLPIRNFNIPDPETDALAAGLFDIRSERFLYNKNVYQKLPVASITKLMTAVVVIESLALNKTFTVAAEDINVDGKGADLYKGEEIRGGDLLKIMLIKSSNDAALTFNTIARREGVDLIGKMNEKGRALGMGDTKFTEPAGLDDDGSFSTVADLIKLVRHVNRYPIIWEILTTRSGDVSSTDGRFKHHLINTNRLLDEMPSIIGGKTGYTDGALETMALELTVNDGRDRLIAVVLGTADRFAETRKLIDWALAAYRWK